MPALRRQRGLVPPIAPPSSSSPNHAARGAPVDILVLHLH
jgi:hypothetical protein